MRRIAGLLVVAIAGCLAVATANAADDAKCQALLGALEGRSHVELAAMCRSQFAPDRCRGVLKPLQDRPWASESIAEACRSLEEEPAIRDLLAQGDAAEVGELAMKMAKLQQLPLDQTVTTKTTTAVTTPKPVVTTELPKVVPLDATVATKTTTTSAPPADLVEFVISNSQLKANSDGLGYRSDTKLKDYTSQTALWDSTVIGTQVSRHWIKVGSLYLPTILKGKRVVFRKADAVGFDSLGRFVFDPKALNALKHTPIQNVEATRQMTLTADKGTKAAANATTDARKNGLLSKLHAKMKAAAREASKDSDERLLVNEKDALDQKWDAEQATKSSASRLLDAVPWAVGTGLAMFSATSLAAFAVRLSHSGNAARTIQSRSLSRAGHLDQGDETSALVAGEGFESDADPI